MNYNKRAISTSTAGSVKFVLPVVDGESLNYQNTEKSILRMTKRGLREQMELVRGGKLFVKKGNTLRNLRT